MLFYDKFFFAIFEQKKNGNWKMKSAKMKHVNIFSLFLKWIRKSLKQTSETNIE
jgi:hypothetical protein